MMQRPLIWHYPHYGNRSGELVAIIRKGEWRLVHYCEGDHNELYDLSSDLGETNDLAFRMPVLSRQLAGELRAWLENVGAGLPSHDPSFDPAAAEARADRYQASLMSALERSHAAMLGPDWKPNADWWGSLRSKD